MEAALGFVGRRSVGLGEAQGGRGVLNKGRRGSWGGCVLGGATAEIAAVSVERAGDAGGGRRL
jgi:hypothetical protein